MAMRGKKPTVDHTAMRAFLKRYACPLPYHAVRARLMGNIATPDLSASPMQEIQRLWKGDLPVFEAKEEAEAFFGTLVQGLWNALSAHQKRNNPFKLARVKTEPVSYAYLARLSKVRREEIEGFIDGLFAGQEEMDLPERTQEAISVLGEVRSLFAATEDLANNPPGPAEAATMEQTAKQLREMTRIAELEINAIVQSCQKARKHMLETSLLERPDTLH